VVSVPTENEPFVPARHESVHIRYRSLIETVSMRQATAWTASNLGHPPFEWSVSLPRMIDMRNAHVWQNVATSQLITRREDGIRGMDHSINPRNSRDAEQHTY
jgi:hypothetical protein